MFYLMGPTSFKLGDTLESIHMPHILDFKYGFDHQSLLNDIDQPEFSMPIVCPPPPPKKKIYIKFIWNADRKQSFIENIRVKGIYLSKALTCMECFLYKQKLLFIKEADTFGHTVV